MGYQPFFVFPDMLTGIKEYACRNLCRVYKIFSRHAADMEVDFLPLYAHETVEVLTQKLPIFLYCGSA